MATVGWSPSTNGTVKGELIAIDANRPEELEKYRGKLGGKIVLMGRPRELEAPLESDADAVGRGDAAVDAREGR